MTFTKRYWPEIALVSLGMLLRLAFASLPLQTLLLLLEDDAWMVTAIARHWALGHGITADGLNPTNGFHPLYPLTLGALPYLLRPDDLDFGFRANLLICALLNGLALLPLYGLARLFARRGVAQAGLAVLALNPLLVRYSVNAMETSLALLLLLLLWWYALARRPADLRGAALLGLLAALAILARLDSMLAAGLLGLALLWRELRARRWPALSATYALVTGALLLPYFARNWLVFGALSPSSGRALAYLHSFRGDFTFTSGLGLIAYQTALDMSWAPSWLYAIVLALLLAMFWTLPGPQRTRMAPLALYALALTLYYSYLQQNGHERYFVGISAVVVLLVCAWFDRRPQPEQARDVRRSSLAAAGPWLVAAAAVALNGGLYLRYLGEAARAPSLAQPQMYQAARWVAANLPPDTRLASSNSGIFQYYSGHVVLNFDGKLNHKIIPVQERRELDVYLRSEGVGYIVDLPDVAEKVEFYSRDLSEARPHAELSSLDKLIVYARLVANKLRLGPPVQLDLRVPDRVLRPFSSVTTVVQQFPLPNDPTRAVTVYRLNSDFGRGQ